MPKIILQPIKITSISFGQNLYYVQLNCKMEYLRFQNRNAGLLYRVPQDNVEKKDEHSFGNSKSSTML